MSSDTMPKLIDPVAFATIRTIREVLIDKFSEIEWEKLINTALNKPSDPVEKAGAAGVVLRARIRYELLQEIDAALALIMRGGVE